MHWNAPTYSGHNKWSKIRHTKGKQDAARSKMYARAANEIILAIRLGSSTDPQNNLRLATALASARKQGLPKENVESAIKRATGSTGSADATENVTYEGLGPGGVALIVEALTDNKVRTIARVRELFRKAGGSMANTSYLFDKRGIVQITLQEGQTMETILEHAIEVGAEDVEGEDGGSVQILCNPTQLMAVAQALKERYAYTLDLIQLGYIPTSTVELEPDQERIQRLIDDLEDEPDIVRVWDNAASA